MSDCARIGATASAQWKREKRREAGTGKKEEGRAKREQGRRERNKEKEIEGTRTNLQLYKKLPSIKGTRNEIEGKGKMEKGHQNRYKVPDPP